MSFKSEYSSILSACLITLPILLSCQEEIRQETPVPGKRISFHVVSDTKADARSTAAPDTFELDFEDQVLQLTVTEDDNNKDIWKGQDLQTRGSAFDNSSHRIPEIDVTALLGTGTGGNLYFKEKVSISDGIGNSERFWPEQKLSFFAFACTKDNVTLEPSFTQESGKCKGSFSYSLPAADSTDPKTDATNQPDIVFAISPDESKEDGTAVDLLFHHALSALEFKVGDVPKDVYLNYISIEGVYSSGTCMLTSVENNDIEFSWSYDGGQRQNGVYTEHIEAPAVSGNHIGSSETIFMMLPQEMGADTRLVVSFNIGGREYLLKKAFREIIASWEADKKYIFRIGLPSQIDVEVEDAVVGTIKKDVTIQNTGSISGYIRAAIVGFWVNNKGDIVAPWSEGDGKFIWGSGWNTKWKLGSDGFYYHLAPVGANQFTYPLFESYTLESSTEIGAQHAFQTLELSIITQIIPEEDKELWPELNK